MHALYSVAQAHLHVSYFVAFPLGQQAMASFGLGAHLPGGGSGFGRPQRHGQQRQQRHRARSSSGAAAGSAPQQQVRAGSSFRAMALQYGWRLCLDADPSKRPPERRCRSPPPPPLSPLPPQGLLDNPWLKSGIISGSLSLAGDVLAQLLTLRGQQQQVPGQGPGWPAVLATALGRAPRQLNMCNAAVVHCSAGLQQQRRL